MKSSLSFNEAKGIPIPDYLSGLGFDPAKIRGNDYWYYSPFREERTPSFKVNTKMNVWFDHGTGEGGTILDLGAKLHECSMREFLDKLSTNPDTFSFHRKTFSIEKPENKLEVISVSGLVNPDLIQYLKKRSIDIDVAKTYCKEVGFRIGAGVYMAIGFPNQSGAFDLRNSWFKGSSSPKDISLIKNGSSRISVLEGFMDFLSVLKIDHSEIKKLVADSDFLVLNSLRLLNRSIPILQPYKEINLFLDNDLPAKEAKENLKVKGIQYTDASPLYGEHKDVNEYVMKTYKEQEGRKLGHRRSKGMRR